MKLKNIVLLFIFSIIVVICSSLVFPLNVIQIGSKAPQPDLQMQDVSGEQYSLNDLKKENGLLILFSCNTCPFVKAWEDRYQIISQLCEKKNVGMAAINSNAARRDGVDSMEEMKKHAKENNYGFNYLVDENARMASLFGATKTPQIFLFNKDLKLVYTGAIDDNLKYAEKVNSHYLLNAINNMFEKKEIDPNKTEALGCSIKKVAVSK